MSNPTVAEFKVKIDRLDMEVIALCSRADEADRRITRLQEQVTRLQSMHAGREPVAYHHTDTGA